MLIIRLFICLAFLLVTSCGTIPGEDIASPDTGYTNPDDLSCEYSFSHLTSPTAPANDALHLGIEWRGEIGGIGRGIDDYISEDGLLLCPELTRGMIVVGSPDLIPEETADYLAWWTRERCSVVYLHLGSYGVDFPIPVMVDNMTLDIEMSGYEQLNLIVNAYTANSWNGHYPRQSMESMLITIFGGSNRIMIPLDIELYAVADAPRTDALISVTVPEQDFVTTPIECDGSGPPQLRFTVVSSESHYSGHAIPTYMLESAAPQAGYGWRTLPYQGPIIHFQTPEIQYVSRMNTGLTETVHLSDQESTTELFSMVAEIRSGAIDVHTLMFRHGVGEATIDHPPFSQMSLEVDRFHFDLVYWDRDYAIFEMPDDRSAPVSSLNSPIVISVSGSHPTTLTNTSWPLHMSLVEMDATEDANPFFDVPFIVFGAVDGHGPYLLEDNPIYGPRVEIVP